VAVDRSIAQSRPLFIFKSADLILTIRLTHFHFLSKLKSLYKNKGISMNQNPLFPAAILFLCLALPVVPAGAAPMVFTVDSTQSQISLSGQIAGYPMTSQGAGSLTTTYSGNLNATVSGSTIQFTGSSTITAKTNGIWQPAVGGGSGSALADYGAQAATFAGTAYGAARNIVLDTTSPLLTLTGTNFDSSALVFLFAPSSASSFDY
jgi:hypothetical protein